MKNDRTYLFIRRVFSGKLVGADQGELITIIGDCQEYLQKTNV